MAPRILIFSIAIGADNSIYVKSIATYAPTFFGYIISVLAIVTDQIYISMFVVIWYELDTQKEIGLVHVG